MTTTRPPRRIVRRAVMAVAGGVVLLVLGGVWLVSREPPEIELSRGLRLGMTPGEVDAVMQDELTSGYGLQSRPRVWVYGADARGLDRLKFKLTEWFGINIDREVTDYPVRVHFDRNWRADRIERGSEVEE
jgi:hypothetical protein